MLLFIVVGEDEVDDALTGLLQLLFDNVKSFVLIAAAAAAAAAAAVKYVFAEKLVKPKAARFILSKSLNLFVFDPFINGCGVDGEDDDEEEEEDDDDDDDGIIGGVF